MNDCLSGKMNPEVSSKFLLPSAWRSLIKIFNLSNLAGLEDSKQNGCRRVQAGRDH